MSEVYCIDRWEGNVVLGVKGNRKQDESEGKILTSFNISNLSVFHPSFLLLFSCDSTHCIFFYIHSIFLLLNSHSHLRQHTDKQKTNRQTQPGRGGKKCNFNVTTVDDNIFFST